MTVYRFMCTECGARFEKRLRYEDLQQPQACPAGHLQTRRVYSAPAVVYKGSGFYSTDHRKGSPATGD